MPELPSERPKAISRPQAIEASKGNIKGASIERSHIIPIAKYIYIYIHIL